MSTDWPVFQLAPTSLTTLISASIYLQVWVRITAPNTYVLSDAATLYGGAKLCIDSTVSPCLIFAVSQLG